MPKLPIAPAEKHIAAFQRDGWLIARMTSSHWILSKPGRRQNLSIPKHGSQPVKRGLLARLIRDAGLTNEDYVALFHSK